MKKILSVAALLGSILSIYTSPITIRDPSALPAVENGFISSSTQKSEDIINVSSELPQNQNSDVKFGHRLSGFHKQIQPDHVSPIPELRSSVIPSKSPEFVELKPYTVLKHNPSTFPKEEILIPSVLPILPSSVVPSVPSYPVIPVTEAQINAEPHHIPYNRKYGRPHVPKHPRKHVPRVIKQRCEIPIIPDHTKPERRHHVPKHTRKADKRNHILHGDYEDDKH